MQAYLDYYKIPGISVAVIKDSKVVYHRGFGVKNTATKEPVTDDTVFEAASMTKPVFAYTVLRLVDRGVLRSTRRSIPISPTKTSPMTTDTSSSRPGWC